MLAPKRLIKSANICTDEKIYKPEELNKLLLGKNKQISQSFKEIKIIGDVIGIKAFKSSGCSFKIIHSNESVICKVWERTCGIYLNDIFKYENNQCIVQGNLNASFFGGNHSYSIDVLSISIISDDTKLKALKIQCEENGYFENKKLFEWNSIKKIGVLSKKGTQGYDDFYNQLIVPIDLKLEEITLEGVKTSNDCINGIDNLQTCDLIVILRGGGDTSEISNSYDTIELFEAIKKSKVPVVTAIGHEQDKDDKLLVTMISDYNYATPTSFVKILNKKLLEPILEKIDQNIELIDEQFNKIYETQEAKLFTDLECFIEKFLYDKFGGRILKLHSNETNIILQKDNKFYNNTLDFSNEIILENDDITSKDKIENSIQERNINKIKKNFIKFNNDNHKLTSSIETSFKNIEKNENNEQKFSDANAKKINTIYLTNFSINTKSFKKLVEFKQMFLWYSSCIKNSENLDITEIGNIYKFINNSL